MFKLQQVKAVKLQIIMSSELVWCFSFPKLAITALLTRLFKINRNATITLYTLSIICLGLSVVISALWWKQCDPVARAWDHDIAGECPRRVHLYWLSVATSIYSAVLDLTLAAYPVYVISRLRMSAQKKMTAGFLFVLTAGAAAVTVYKATTFSGGIAAFNGSDPTYNSLSMVVATSAESSVLIIVANAPTLGPIIMGLHSKVFEPTGKVLRHLKRSILRKFDTNGKLETFPPPKGKGKGLYIFRPSSWRGSRHRKPMNLSSKFDLNAVENGRAGFGRSPRGSNHSFVAHSVATAEGKPAREPSKGEDWSAKKAVDKEVLVSISTQRLDELPKVHHYEGDPFMADGDFNWSSSGSTPTSAKFGAETDPLRIEWEPRGAKTNMDPLHAEWDRAYASRPSSRGTRANMDPVRAEQKRGIVRTSRKLSSKDTKSSFNSLQAEANRELKRISNNPSSKSAKADTHSPHAEWDHGLTGNLDGHSSGILQPIAVPMHAEQKCDRKMDAVEASSRYIQAHLDVAQAEWELGKKKLALQNASSNTKPREDPLPAKSKREPKQKSVGASANSKAHASSHHADQELELKDVPAKATSQINTKVDPAQVERKRENTRTKTPPSPKKANWVIFPPEYV